MPNSISSLLKKSIGLSGFVLLLVVWSLCSRSVNSLVLPSPQEVWQALYDLGRSGELLTNYVVTLRRTLIGFLIAFLAGMGGAVLMSRSSVFRRIFSPLVILVQTTPPVIWLVLAIIWFGIAQELTPIFIIFIIVFPVVLVSLLEGLDSFDQELIQMAKAFNCPGSRVFFHILLPGISPCVISSVRVGFAFAWKSTVLAEFLGSSSGVGFMLSLSNSFLDTASVFAWALVLVLTMLGLQYFLISPVRKRVNLWTERAKS